MCQPAYLHTKLASEEKWRERTQAPRHNGEPEVIYRGLILYESDRMRSTCYPSDPQDVRLVSDREVIRASPLG